MKSLRSPRFVRKVAQSCVWSLLFAAFFCFSITVSLKAQAAHFAGTPSTVAGTLSSPGGVALDVNGNLYIADAANNRVLRVPATDPTCSTPSDCTTVGTGLSNPQGVAVDGNGNVLIADTGNNRGVRVPASDLTCSTPSDCQTIGLGLSSPMGIAVDSNGDIYVADTNNNRVWIVLPTDLTCSSPSDCATIGGSLSLPQSIALDAANNLYIADTGNNRVVRVPVSDLYCSTPSDCRTVGTGLTGPRGVSLDSLGDVFVANSGGNNVVEVANQDWTCATAGDCRTFGQVGLSNPGGLAMDSLGNIYLADTGNNRALKLQAFGANLGTVNVGSASTTATLYFVFDSAGSLNSSLPLEVLTQGGNGWDFTDAGTGTCSSVSSYSVGSTCTVTVNFSPSGAGLKYGAVELFGSTGAPIALGYVYGTGSAPQVTFVPGVQSTIWAGDPSFNPFGVAVDEHGDIFAAAYKEGNVIQFVPSGSGYTQSAVITGLTTPRGVAVDGAGNLFIATGSGAYKAQCASGACTVLPAILTTSAVLDGIAVDQFGNVYFADYYGATIYKYTYYNGTYTQAFAIPLSGGEGPTGVAVDASGNIFVCNYATGTIYEFKPSRTGYSRSTVISGLSAPEAIALDASGSIYVTASGNNSIYKYTPSGGGYTQSTIATNVSPQPWWIALDGSGNLYFSSCNGPDTCTGTDGVYSINVSDTPAPSLTFASTALGATSSDSPKGFGVWNIGNAPLIFTTPGSGTNPSYPTDFPVNSADTQLCSSASPLAAGATCDVSVDFTPLSAGSLSETVTLTDNALNGTNVQQTIGVSGTGTGALITITPGTLPAFTYNAAITPVSFSASGGTAPYTFSVSSGSLPPGLTLVSGTLSGTPTSAGSYTFTVQAQDSASNTASQSYSATVNKATPTLSVTNSPVTYNGSAQAATVVGSVPGTVSNVQYGGSATVPTAAGTYAITADFTPTDTSNYATVTGGSAGSFVISQATPTLSISNPSVVYTGSAQTATVTGSVPGSVTAILYNGSSTAPTTVGVYTVTASFTPTDTTNYASLTGAAAGTFTITKATPVITWSTPAAITYGTALSTTQLDATSTVAGSLVYTPASGTVLGAGTKTLSVTLTPTDTTDYTTATQTVQLVVNQAAPSLSVTNSPVTYNGSAQSATVTGSVGGSVSNVKYNGLATVPTAAGTYAVTADFTPTDTTDYSSLTGAAAGNFVISKATPTITWSTPAAITYGTALSATQLDASSTVAGSFVYTPASGTVLAAGTQTLSVTLTPSDNSDYNNATQTVQIVVGKATPAITWATPAAISYGTALSAAQLDASSAVAGSFVYTPAAGAVLGAGTQTLSVTLTPTDTTDYTTATQTVQLVVNKAAPAITWATPSAINYGTALSSTQLDATSTVAGSFVYTPASGTVLAAGTQTLSVTLTPTDTADYTAATQTVQLVVNKAGAPTITWATPAAITYGTALSAAQLDASTTIPGSFVYTPAAGAVLPAGTQTLSVTFDPTDSTDYPTATQTVQIVVNKATPTVTWAAPAAITYGTALSATQLNATGSVPGSFAYSPVAGTVLTAGTQTLSVTFTPTDATDYASVTQTVQIVVNKATPSITWSAPAAIAYGTALSSTQLDATSTIPGTFVYSPAAGTVLSAGTQTLSVTLTPNDAVDYSDATATVPITVNQGTAPTITWTNPAAITYGTALSATQLDATTSIPGTFAYTPAAGTVLTAGVQTLSVTFTPTDTTDYPTATKTVQITVNKATPGITWSAPAAISYGTALSATQLNASSTVAGALVYTPAAGAVLNAGSQTLSVTLTPTDSTDYNQATQTVSLTVNQAAQTITFNPPASVAYGSAAIALAATGGGSGNPVTFTLVSGPATLTGSTLTFTGIGTVVVDANQAGNANYLAAAQVAKSINVTNAALMVTANNASRAYGAANPTFSGSVTGAVNGDTFSETFSTSATAASTVGTYAIVPAVSGSNLSAYTVNIQNGTLTVTQASTTTALAVSSSSINPGQSVTLTATVASSTSGTPTGSVSFYNGSTLLGSGTLSSGAASFSTSTLASGSDSITAVYSGDINFSGSSTTAATTITVAALDFTLKVSGTSDEAIKQGGDAYYQLAVDPTFGNYPGTVTFSATGLPTGATVTFSPSSVAANAGQQSITATVVTAPAVGSNVAPAIGKKLAPLGLALILLPLAGAKRMRRHGRGMSGLLTLLLLLEGLATAAAVSGCGSDISKKSQQSQSYTITITATGGSTQHAVNVTLEIN